MALFDSKTKHLNFPDYPASRPGVKTWIMVGIIICFYIGIAHGNEIRAMFGF